jgi:hypothetical protein
MAGKPKLITKPPHAPTDATRQTVQLHTMVGTTQADIARVLDIDEKTLRKYYRDELDLAKAKANATIGGALFNKAKTGDTAAMIFWMKTQAGWRERKDINHTSEDASMSPKPEISAVDAIEAAKQYQKIIGKDE